MAFPTTGILDNFTRANETPLSDGGNWTQHAWATTTATIDLVSNQAVEGTEGGGFPSAVWNPLTLTATEAYMILGNTNGLPNLMLRAGNLGASSTGYDVELTTLTSVSVAKRGTTLATYTIASALAGDMIGASMVGSSLTTYYKAGAGAWTALGTVTDSAFTSGYIGIAFDSTSGGSISAFGGGAAPGGVASSNFFPFL